MEEKLNTVQALIGVLNSPIAQRKGVTISPEHCKIWVEELTKFMQEHGWHPVSEPPKEDGEYLVLTVWGPTKDMPFYAKFENGKWSIPQVKWWIAPPKKEK